MQERYFEKMWKCEYCRTDDLSALRNFRCPNCGSPKPEQDYEYYSTKEIFDEEGLKLAKGKQNWVCGYCGSANIGERELCSNCNGAKTEGTSFVERELDFNPLEAENKFRGTKYQKPKESPLPKEAPVLTPAAPKPSGKKTPFVLLGLLAVFLIIGGFFLVSKLSTANYNGEISQFSWETSSTLQRLTLTEEKSRSVPSGAFNVVKKREFSHTEDIYEERTVTVYETKYIDKGNGSVVEQQVPVETTERVKVGEKEIYETVYYYDILKWKEVDYDTLKGTGKEIKYPERIVNTSIPQHKEGAERVEEKAQYFLHVAYTKKGKKVEARFPVDYSEFEAAKLGDSVQIQEVFDIPSRVVK